MANLSVRVDPEAERILESLKELWGEGTSTTIRRALRETYAAEVKRLQAVRIGRDNLGVGELTFGDGTLRDAEGRVVELRPADL